MRGRLGIGLFVVVCSLAFSGCLGCGGAERQDEDEVEGEFPVDVVSSEFALKQRLAESTEFKLTIANAGEETIPNLAVTVFTEKVDEATAADTADAEDADPESGETATNIDGEEIPEDELGSAVDQALQEELQDGEDPDGAEESSADEETTTDEETVEETETGDDVTKAKGAFSVLSDQPGLAIPSRPVWILEQGYPLEAGEEPGPAPVGELEGGGGADTANTNTFSFGPLDPNSTKELIWLVTPVQPGTYTVHYRIAAGLQGKAVAVTTGGSVPEGEFEVAISNVPPQTRVDDNGKVVPIKKGDIIGQAGSEDQKGELGE